MEWKTPQDRAEHPAGWDKSTASVGPAQAHSEILSQKTNKQKLDKKLFRINLRKRVAVLHLSWKQKEISGYQLEQNCTIYVEKEVLEDTGRLY
jgi:hypothetical protein